MWPHEMLMFSKWYVLAGSLAVGLALYVVADGVLYYARWRVLTNGYLAACCFLTGLLCMALIVFINFGTPLKQILLYLFYGTVLVYPVFLSMAAAVRWALRLKPDGDIINNQLNEALRENSDYVFTVLKKIVPGIHMPDKLGLVRALCHDNPEIRQSAVNAALAAGMNQDIEKAVQGDTGDFERLGDLGDEDFLYRLMPVAAKDNKEAMAAARGLLAMAQKNGISPDMAYVLLKILQDGPSGKTTEFILNRLLENEYGGVIYEKLLQDQDKKIQNLAAQFYFEALKKGSMPAHSSWRKADKIFLNRHARGLTELMCSHKPNDQRSALNICSLLGVSIPSLQTGKRAGDYFVQLGRSEQPWILEQLIRNARSKKIEIALPAVRGLAAMVETGRIPAGLQPSLKSGRIRTSAPEQANTLDAPPPEFLPVTGEVLSLLYEKIKPSLERGLCHPDGQIRQEAARLAVVFGMDPAITAAVRGDLNDFERLGESVGGEFLLDPLLNIALEESQASEPAARGLAGLYHRLNISQEYLKKMILQGRAPVPDIAIEALAKKGDAGAGILLGLLKSNDVGLRKKAAKALVACAQKAENGFGDHWWTMKNLITAPHTDTTGSHQDGYHCDYDRGCTIYGCDPHTDMMVKDRDGYRVHRMNRTTPHSDNMGIGLKFDP